MRRSLFVPFLMCAFIATLLALAWGALPALTVQAKPNQPQATYIVTRADDPTPGACAVGDCSLREAVIAANANPGATIQLTNGTTYVLTIPASGNDDATTGDLNLTQDTTFSSVGCFIFCSNTIQGGPGWADRLMTIGFGAHVFMSGIYFTNGNTQDQGGALAISSNAMVTLTFSTVTGNYAYQGGGGIANYGSVYLAYTFVDTNTTGFEGGGLYNAGTATLFSGSANGNTVNNGSGGGIKNDGGSLTVISSTLNSNTASSDGGGLDTRGTVAITGTQVSGNQALNGGGVFQSGGNTALNDVTFDGNTATGGGGGFFNENFSKVTLVNSAVQNGTANFGAGLVNDTGGIINLSDTQVITNHTSGNGGGIWNGSIIVLNNNSLLRNNSSVGNGGGLINYGVATLNNSMLLKNATECDTGSTGYGGGIYNVNQLVLNTSVITASYACYGGGIYNFGAISGQGNTIAYNHGYFDGGGLYVNPYGTVTLGGGSISNNLVSYGGSGLLNQGSVALNQVDLVGNTGAHYGGGAENFGTLSMTGGNVMSNIVDTDGAGVYNDYNGHLTLANVAFISNTVQSGSDGGGLFAAGIVNATGLLFRANQASRNGGGVEAAGTLTLTNSTFSGNSAAQGGGMNNEGTTLLNNVTIAGNTNYGLYNGYTLNVANTIIAGNTGGDCHGTLTSHGYNLIQSTTNCTISGDTTGNLLNANPQLGPLQDNGGLTWTRALLNNSPAINAGNPAASDGLNYHCLPADQRGALRTNRCDIGAYEVGGLPNRVLLPIVIR